MSSTPFGEHLKREREMRGVSLNEISAATRISTRFLEAIENDRWSELPGGAFNRGFIRSIARYLGLDEDSIVAEYSLDTSGNANAREPAQFVEAGRNWRPVVMVAAMLLALLGAGVLVHHFFGLRIMAILRGRYGPAAASTRLTSADVPPGAPSQTKAQSAAASADSQADPAPGGTLLALSIGIEKPGYLKVVADGQTVFRGRVRASYSHSFEARSTLEIFSSRASGVRLNLNGQSVPFPPTPGKIARIKLSKNDLRPIGGVH